VVREQSEHMGCAGHEITYLVLEVGGLTFVAPVDGELFIDLDITSVWGEIGD
jgi:hypothetical protein